MVEEKNRAIKKSITIPRSMNERAMKRAANLGLESDLNGEVNFSAYIRHCIKKDLEEA